MCLNVKSTDQAIFGALKFILMNHIIINEDLAIPLVTKWFHIL